MLMNHTAAHSITPYLTDDVGACEARPPLIGVTNS
jgi:hypothetical protein